MNAEEILIVYHYKLSMLTRLVFAVYYISYIKVVKS